ncbi:MAG: glycosyltransferase [Hormoscilla sp. GUM202]|nr:glycosyltransferase [Hormoscilla sp. GUM202]
MKVLHVIPSVSTLRGGPSYAVINMVKSLRQVGVDAEIITTNDNGSNGVALDVTLSQRTEYQQVPIWFFPCQENSGQALTKDKGFIFSLPLTFWLWQHIRDYDLIHTHYLFSYASTCAAFIARKQGIPYIRRTIGQLSPWALAQSRLKKQIYSFLIERGSLNDAAAIHCTSEEEATDVRKFGIVAPTVTLPLGVELVTQQVNAKTKLRAVYGISLETPVVLFLSRLHYKKRPDLLIEALHQLKSQSHNFYLMMAGSGDTSYVQELKNLANNLGLGDRTCFPGFVTGEDKQLLLQGSDIFVLPSFSDNFGIAVAEAMAAKLPVIVTPEVQIASGIVAAEAGLIIEGEVEALARAIAKLLSSPDYRRQLGENAARVANQHYCWQTIAQNLTFIYSSIIQQKPLPLNLNRHLRK